VAEYHALDIVARQHSGRDGDQEAEEVISKLLSVLKKVKSIDPRPLARVGWPLAVAAGVVKDPKERSWIQETIHHTRLITGASSCTTWLPPR